MSLMRFYFQHLGGAAGHVKCGKMSVDQMHGIRRMDGRHHMTSLMGEGIYRHAEGSSGSFRRRYAGQKARHIGAFRIPGIGRDADGRNLAGLRRLGFLHGTAQLLHHLRQIAHMMKDRITLTQSTLPFCHRQKKLCVAKHLSRRITQCGRGGIVTGIDTDKQFFAHSASVGASVSGVLSLPLWRAI